MAKTCDGDQGRDLGSLVGARHGQGSLLYQNIESGALVCDDIPLK